MKNFVYKSEIYSTKIGIQSGHTLKELPVLKKKEKKVRVSHPKSASPTYFIIHSVCGTVFIRINIKTGDYEERTIELVSDLSE
jgi:hypothetical protein